MIVFGSPFRYFQGFGILDQAGKLLGPMGNRFLLIGDALVFDLLADRLEASFAARERTVTRGLFGGECTSAEIGRLTALCRETGCDAVLGAGGGKAMDTAKAVSVALNAPVALLPTAASSDAPVSHVAIVYREDHSNDRVAYMRYAPWCVLVDTAIILNSPARLFVSGIGDAMATKFEADACLASGALTGLRGRPPRAAGVLCDLCWQILRDHGPDALEALNNRRHNEAFEQVVEATTLLSGLGFENGGLAAAHAVSMGLSVIPSIHGSTHGETVAFGLLAQFVLEQRSKDFMRDMLGFMGAVGLPVTLAELGLRPEDDALLRDMAEAACVPTGIMRNMPRPVTAEQTEEAVRTADRLGRDFRLRCSG